MALREWTADEAKELFRNNLRAGINDAFVLDYVVNLLVDFFQSRKLEIVSDQKPLSVKVDELWRSHDRVKSYMAFKGIGDAYLWLCGFMPENLSKKRKHQLGVEWYIEKGRDAYNGAIYLANAHKIRYSPTEILCKVSDRFERCSRAILEMRAKLNNKGMMMEPDVAREISKVLYNGNDISVHLAMIAGEDRPYLRIVR